MDDATRHIPLKPVDLQILLVLTEQDLHGYGIVKDIEARTEGQIRLEPGNLYRYIRRLESEGLVDEATTEAREPGEERRRYYTVTGLGRRVLQAEAARMRALAAVVEAQLATGRGTP